MRLSTIFVIVTLLYFPLSCLASKEIWQRLANETSKDRTWYRLLLLSALGEAQHLDLCILYGNQHKDIAEMVSQELSPSLTSGLVMYHYDWSPSTLTRILTLGLDSIPVLLIPLCNPDNMVDIFKLIKRHRLKSHLVYWLLIFYGEESSLDTVVHGLEGLIHEGTRVGVVAKNGRNGSLSMFSSQADINGTVRLVEKCTWIQKLLHHEFPLWQCLFTEDDQFYENMGGRRMLIGVNDLLGFFGTEDSLEVEDPKKLQGIDGKIIGALSGKLHFTFRTVRPPDGLWGNSFPNGSFNGMIGMTAGREVDFSISCIAMTDTRGAVIDYTVPYSIESHRLVSSAPEEKDRVLAILLPFTSKVWFALIMTTLFMGPLLTFYSKLLNTFLDEEPIGNLGNFSFNVFRNLVVQGNRLRSRHWLQRCLFIIWYLFCLVISALYSGMLTAVLAIPEFETPINFLTDLPKAVEDGYVIGVLEGSAEEYIFKTAKSGIYKDTWDLFDQDNTDSLFSQPEAAIERVLQQKYVVISFVSSDAVKIYEVGREKYHIGTQDIYSHSLAMICPEGAAYRKTFDKMLMLMVEGGLVLKWKDDELYKVIKGGSRVGNGSSRISAFSLSHLQAAFILVFLGCLIASLLFVFENVGAYYKKFITTITAFH